MNVPTSFCSFLAVESTILELCANSEIEYFIFLINETKPKGTTTLSEDDTAALRNIYKNFTEEDANRVKEIERTTNHDVKAVEYFIKENIINNIY